MVVRNDLVLESQRDSSSTNSNGFNLSGGFSMGASDKYAGGDTRDSKVKASQQIGARTGDEQVSSVNASYGANTGRTKVKQTILSSLTGNKVEIDVNGNTNIKGALIASGKFDKDGNFIDNEKLKLTTKTLSFANNTNSRFSSNSGFNVGANVGLTLNAKDTTPNDNNNTNKPKINSTNVGFNIEKGYKRSKTLATLGKGDIVVKDKDNSDELDLLNTNTQAINKNLTDVKTGTSVQASVDHRLFSEDGRKQIKKDFKLTELMLDNIKNITTSDAKSISDFFNDNIKSLAIMEGVEKRVVNDKKLQEQLSSPNLTKKQKDNMYGELVKSVAIELGYIGPEVITVSTNETGKNGTQIKGHYNNNEIFMNDKYIDSTKEGTFVAGHELNHYLDDKGNKVYSSNKTENENLEEQSADMAGSQFQNVTEFVMGQNGKELSSSNNHVVMDTTIPSIFNQDVIDSNNNFATIDKSKGMDRRLSKDEIKYIQENIDGFKEFMANKYKNFYLFNETIQNNAEAIILKAAKYMVDKELKDNSQTSLAVFSPDILKVAGEYLQNKAKEEGKVVRDRYKETFNILPMFTANEKMYKNPNYDLDKTVGLTDSSEVLFTLTPTGKIVSTGVSKAVPNVLNSGKYVIKKSDAVYDDITLKMTGSIEKIVPNTLTPKNTIMTIGGIEISNDIFNESSPIPSTFKGTLGALLNNISNENEKKLEEKSNYLKERLRKINNEK